MSESDFNFPWLDSCDAGDLARFQIVHIALEKHPALIKWLFMNSKPEMFAGAEEVIARAGAFSGGEIILIKLACDIWFGGNRCPIGDIVRRLDGSNFVSALSAIVKWRSM